MCSNVHKELFLQNEHFPRQCESHWHMLSSREEERCQYRERENLSSAGFAAQWKRPSVLHGGSLQRLTNQTVVVWPVCECNRSILKGLPAAFSPVTHQVWRKSASTMAILARGFSVNPELTWVSYLTVPSTGKEDNENGAFIILIHAKCRLWKNVNKHWKTIELTNRGFPAEETDVECVKARNDTDWYRKFLKWWYPKTSGEHSMQQLTEELIRILYLTTRVLSGEP